MSPYQYSRCVSDSKRKEDNTNTSTTNITTARNKGIAHACFLSLHMPLAGNYGVNADGGCALHLIVRHTCSVPTSYFYCPFYSYICSHIYMSTIYSIAEQNSRQNFTRASTGHRQQFSLASHWSHPFRLLVSSRLLSLSAPFC